MSNKQIKLVLLNEASVFDAYIMYQFLKKLTTPFNKTQAFKLGIIDEDGKILRKRSSLKTSEEKAAYTIFDTFVFNIKKLIEKVPGGKSQLASYAAALFLIREEKNAHFYDDEDITYEAFMDFFEAILRDGASMSQLQKLIDEDGVPANNAGSGAIAGLQGDPPIHLKKKKKKKFKEF